MTTPLSICYPDYTDFAVEHRKVLDQETTIKINNLINIRPFYDLVVPILRSVDFKREVQFTYNDLRLTWMIILLPEDSISIIQPLMDKLITALERDRLEPPAWSGFLPMCSWIFTYPLQNTFRRASLSIMVILPDTGIQDVQIFTQDRTSTHKEFVYQFDKLFWEDKT